MASTQRGGRFALLGTCHESRHLAVTLAQMRLKKGPPLTAAQRALAQYHAAYRDLQAVLLAADDKLYDRVPAAGGNLTILKALLDHGADANARQQNDFVPLHTVAENGDRAMAELLLASGADPDAVTADGRSPRDIAQAAGQEAIESLLA